MKRFEAATGLVEANGTKLYHEIRGDGPPVVFIPGAGGDAGGFEAAANHPTIASLVLEGAECVSTTTGGPLTALPGDHMVYITRPTEFAEALRAILTSMS